MQGLLQLGRGMGLQVIAEGIEDLDQADWLLDHGCAMAQGYAFGRPAPLPSPAEVLIGELTDAPAEDVAGELLADPIAAAELPVGSRTAPQRGSTAGDYDTGRLDRRVRPDRDATGELFDELADEPEDD